MGRVVRLDRRLTVVSRAFKGSWARSFAIGLLKNKKPDPFNLGNKKPCILAEQPELSYSSSISSGDRPVYLLIMSME